MGLNIHFIPSILNFLYSEGFMLFFFTFLLFYLFIVVIFLFKLFKLLIGTMTRVLNFFLNHLFTSHEGESLATNLAKCNKWRKYGILLVGIS